MFQLTKADEAMMAGLNADLIKVIRRAAYISDIRFKITEGLRTVARQRLLVKQGASKTMNSRHLTGHAFDAVPMVDTNGDGKVSHQEMYAWPLYYKLAKVFKKAAADVGIPIEWGGDWKTFKDGPHWQLPFKQYPKQKAMGLISASSGIDMPEVADAEEYTLETDNEAHAKTIGTVGLGVSSGVGMGYEPVQDVVNTLAYQQGELTSGDLIRIGIAVVIVGVSLWLAWRQWKSQ